MDRPPGPRAAGMTTKEMLLVMVVLGAGVLVFVHRQVERRQLECREVTVQHILLVQQGLDRFALDNAGRFPPAAPGLELLVKPPTGSMKRRLLRWRGPYVPAPDDILDGWGREFHYCLGGPGDPPPPYQLWSDGRDNSDGGVGMDADINVWKPDSLVP